MKAKDPILASYLEERSSALLYKTMAEVEQDPRLAEVYKRISITETGHAETWLAKAKENGLKVPEWHPTWRIRTLVYLAKHFGPSMILPTIQGMEQTSTSGYTKMPGASAMVGQEQSHARLMDIITGSVRGGLEGGVLAQIEGRHRSGGGNALRAAVLGANDGLVSNLSLVMGVAGAALSGRAVLIAGVSGLLAGAISMALGEWLSVTSSRELYRNQIATEATEIEENPEEEVEELNLIYQSRGIKPDVAKALATQMMTDKESALDTLSREELGVNPKELGGSAWEAAITSFLLFTIGAIVPVAPFIFWQGMTAVLISVAFSTVGLFLLGTAITLFTGRGVLFSGMRMVVFGLVAAGVTYGIGHVIGGGIAAGG